MNPKRLDGNYLTSELPPVNITIPTLCYRIAYNLNPLERQTRVSECAIDAQSTKLLHAIAVPLLRGFMVGLLRQVV